MQIESLNRQTALTAMVLLLGPTLTGCGSKEARQEEARREQAAVEAELLGQEIFDLVDRTMAYHSSHSGRLPRRLRDVGIDSLTPSTKRWLKVRSGSAHITVAYRRPAGHAVSACRGTEAVLEELALEGSFELACTLLDGEETQFRVERTP